MKSVFRYIYFLRSYKHLEFLCVPLHEVLNVGPLLCQASVQSILITVMNNWVDYCYSCQISKKFILSQQTVQKYSNIKFDEHPSCRVELLHADGHAGKYG